MSETPTEAPTQQQPDIVDLEIPTPQYGQVDQGGLQQALTQSFLAQSYAQNLERASGQLRAQVEALRAQRDEARQERDALRSMVADRKAVTVAADIVKAGKAAAENGTARP